MDNPVGPDGKFLADVPLFAGLHVFAANDRVIDALKAHGMLLRVARLQHSYPHCWRHKTPIIFRATPQWFIGMDQHGLRARVLDEIKKLRFTPDWGEARLQGMVENLSLIHISIGHFHRQEVHQSGFAVSGFDSGRQHRLDEGGR